MFQQFLKYASAWNRNPYATIFRKHSTEKMMRKIYSRLSYKTQEIARFQKVLFVNKHMSIIFWGCMVCWQADGLHLYEILLCKNNFILFWQQTNFFVNTLYSKILYPLSKKYSLFCKEYLPLLKVYNTPHYYFIAYSTLIKICGLYVYMCNFKKVIRQNHGHKQSDVPSYCLCCCCLPQAWASTLQELRNWQRWRVELWFQKVCE